MPILSFLAHLFITAGLLLVVTRLVPGVKVDGWKPALIGAFVMGITNAIVKPVMVVLTLPLTIITLGLFLLVINALMLWLVGVLVRGIKVTGFGAALLGSVVLALLNLVVEAMIGGGWSRLT